jgi:uncharacterized membrane protein YkoI
MRTIGNFVLAATLLFSAGALAKTGVDEDLSKEAKISEPEARRIALARVPGIVRTEELEREHHRVVYSYDIERAGKPGVEEVQVDAKSGKIVSVKHESDKAEDKEKKDQK